MNIYQIVMGVGMVFFACACEQKDALELSSGLGSSSQTNRDMPTGEVTHYERTVAGGGPSYVEAPGLCKLVKDLFMGEAGLFKVKELAGMPEEVPGKPGYFDGFTYVDLELVAPWTLGTSDVVVARIVGGPTGKGSVQLWDVDLEVGETIGAILWAKKNNKDYPSLHPLGVFKKQASGGYSNGIVFTKETKSAEEIGVMVAAIAVAEDGECPYDAEPYTSGETAEPPEEGQPEYVEPEKVE